MTNSRIPQLEFELETVRKLFTAANAADDAGLTTKLMGVILNLEKFIKQQKIDERRTLDREDVVKMADQIAGVYEDVIHRYLPDTMLAEMFRIEAMTRAAEIFEIPVRA